MAQVERQQFFVGPLCGQAAAYTLALYLEAVTLPMAFPSPTDQWSPLPEATELVRYSQHYLILLAHIGRLEAVKRARS